MEVKLYGMAGSPNVRGAMLGLAEKGVHYELVTVLPPFKDPEHMTRNPFGRVPVLEHDGFMLYETQAILRYVDETFPGPQLQPTDRYEVARMNQILGIIDCYLFKSWSADIGFERLIAPTYFKRPSNAAVIDAAVPLARCAAEALDSLIASPHRTGNTYSLADIRLVPHFAWFRATPEGQALLDGKDKLQRWFNTVSDRDTVQRVLAQ
jgi:glutathione S-transferase